MGLRFLFGRSGVGKTKYLREKIIESAIKNPKTNYIIMVPEQSNLQTQTDYVLAHPSGGILNIDILSFKRLAYKIFGETGGYNNRILDESGKLMVLKKIVKNEKDKLTLLEKPLERIDSISKLKSILSEFAQYHVTGKILKNVIEDAQIPGLSQKLSDLTVLHEAFLDYISDEYITDEQVMDVLAKKIEVSEYVKNTVFVFDDYTGFTFLQNEVLRKLMRYAKEVIVSLTMDVSYANETVVPMHDLFALSVRTKTELSNIAIEEKVKIHKPVCLNKSGENGTEEFKFLEKYIFDYSSPSYTKATERIVISENPSPEKEIMFLRSMISKLVREEGYAYKDIAVVTGALDKYGMYFEKSMNEAHIPCFVDDSKALPNNSFLEAVRALLKIIIEDFSYKSVFRYFRSNMSSFDMEEIDKLENYVVARGIRSFYAWEHEWNKCIKNQTVQELAEINILRERFICDIKEFVFVMKNKSSDIRDKAYSLYSFLADLNAESKLKTMSESFEAEGDYVRSVEYKQVYAAVINLLDELVEIMGREVVSNEEFLDILDAGFSAVKIGVLPPGNDYVILGDVERTRFSKTKVLFLLGANEGIIPKSNEKIGFINESERLFLKEAGIALAPTSHEEYYTQRYYLYRMLTKATERLYICYSSLNREGEEINPSYIVKNIEEMFPNSLRTGVTNEYMKVDALETQADAYDFLLNEENRKHPLWENIYSYLSKTDQYNERLRKFQEGVIYRGNQNTLGEELAEKLFLNKQSNLIASVSRLESFSTCPFAHFLRYGLHLQERVTPEMASVDYGTIFHFALENYVKLVKQMNLTVTDITDETMDAMAKDCINRAYEVNYRAYNEPSARDKYHIKRMIRLMKRTIWAMKKQFDDSEFTIKDVEVKFGSDNNSYAIPLSQNRKLFLNGKIDRIDTVVDGEKEYVRIVDYKTGSTGFSMLKFYHGIQLQLIVYLDVISQMEKSYEPDKNIIPAGAFYYNINDPVIEAKKIKNDDVDSAILNELKLKGYQNDELEKFSDKKIDGETLNLLMKHGRNVVRDLGNSLASGNAMTSPYQLYDGGLKDACTYCNYKGVCSFDSSLPWCKLRRLKNYKEAEIIDKIYESEGAEDEVDR